MKLILHDLTEEQCQQTGLDSLSKEEFILVDGLGIDRYCIGCFACWLQKPGKCIIKDEYQNMGINLSKVDEFIIISKSSFGSYSSAVKNVLDRSIAYVMPYFEIRKGEMHHQERYKKDLVISAAFYGADITEDEKETSRNLVKANAVNLNATLGKIEFLKEAEDVKEVLAWF